jgi:hypothetical protein
MVEPVANGFEKPVSHGGTMCEWLPRASPPMSVASVVLVHLPGRVAQTKILEFHSSFEIASVTEVNSSMNRLEAAGANDEPLKTRARG